jgi:hypothetical protein
MKKLGRDAPHPYEWIQPTQTAGREENKKKIGEEEGEDLLPEIEILI